VFDVAKNHRRQESGDPGTLEFEIEGIPEELQVFLLDVRFDRFVDLRLQDSYECTLGEKPVVAGVDQARFEFLVGSEAFIQARREGLSGTSFTNRLFQNYPNPFRSDTMIRYEVAEPGPVRMQVFDTQGRLVRSLIDSNHEAGRYEARWNGRNDHGQGVAPGIYFFRVTSPHLQQTRRMVLIQ